MAVLRSDLSSRIQPTGDQGFFSPKVTKSLFKKPERRSYALPQKTDLPCFVCTFEPPVTYLDVSADRVIILNLVLCPELAWCSVDTQNNSSGVLCCLEKDRSIVQCFGKRTRQRVNPHLETCIN